ncbi:hypothetical protein RHS04_01742 [Rhizoctonia solani]|uniref:Uncharacterized protein n=1 Tax=Rhizoctonia solani TaxID=456999 RepID=A0A8H7HG80_9AGAM|nr:hypothetical protein RHS04_01742 [Rhizoctonia solani]
MASTHNYFAAADDPKTPVRCLTRLNPFFGAAGRLEYVPGQAEAHTRREPTRTVGYSIEARGQLRAFNTLSELFWANPMDERLGEATISKG